MGTFNFKSVGKTVEQSLQALSSSAPPVGIKTPLEIGFNEGIFAMHFNNAEQIHDNLRNLLLTNWGERVIHYAFGANLRKLTTEFVSQDDFDTVAIANIRDAVNKWMPYVDLEDFSSVVDHHDNKNTAIIRVTITYNVPALGVKGKKLQIVLYAI